MTELTKAYIEQIANGTVPSRSSEERAAYADELGFNRDYTWALQQYQVCREVVREYHEEAAAQGIATSNNDFALYVELLYM
jgi:hypothetical protein